MNSFATVLQNIYTIIFKIEAYIEDIEYDTYIMGKNEYDETVKKLTAFEMWVPIDNLY